MILRESIQLLRESDQNDQLDTLITLCEEAGFEGLEENEISDILDFVESEILSAELDEGLGRKIKAAFHRVASAFHRRPKKHSHLPLRVLKDKEPARKSKMWVPGQARRIAARM